MVYKYFTWKEGDYYRGQNLVYKPNIINLLKIIPSKTDTYATIQDYDEEGNVIGCPLYFDIDSDNLYDSHKTALNVYRELKEDLNIEPFLYFSGSKGFHILMPLYIKHSRCHEIAKEIALDYADKEDIDMVVYRQRSMFRIPRTYNSKSDNFKILINKDDINDLEKIKKYSKENKSFKRRFACFNSPYWDDLVSDKINDLSQKRDTPATRINNQDVFPCISKLLTSKIIPKGERHSVVYILVRYFYQKGFSSSDIETLFRNHPFYGHEYSRSYMKVVNSVFRSGKSGLTCRYGVDGEILQSLCEDSCPLKISSNNLGL